MGVYLFPFTSDTILHVFLGADTGAWSRNARIGNLQDFAEAVNFLTERGIVTLEDLEAHIAAQSERTEAINTSMKTKSARLNELKELLRLVDLYRNTKPIRDDLRKLQQVKRNADAAIRQQEQTRQKHREVKR